MSRVLIALDRELFPLLQEIPQIIIAIEMDKYAHTGAGKVNKWSAMSLGRIPIKKARAYPGF